MSASVSVFLDLSVMGKEFTTTQWELATSTAEIILPVYCPIDSGARLVLALI